jgi:ribonuclease P protein component
MPSKRLRLPRSGFQAPKTAKRLVSPHISLVFYPALPRQAGIAVVLSKKVVGTSVGRHRVKRRLFSVMQGWRQPGMAVIAYGRAGIALVPFQELREELGALYARLPAR